MARHVEGDAKLLYTWLLFTWPITWMVLLQGQPVALSACLLAVGWWYWQHRSRAIAGFLWAWLAIKPQLGIFVWLWILWRRDRATIRGLLLGGMSLLVLTSVTTGGHSLIAWGEILRFTAEATGSYGIPPTRMPNIFGALSVLGVPEHWAWSLWGLAAALLVFWLVRLWQRTENDHLAFVAAVVGTLLLTPHSFLHDMLLLAAIAPLLWQSALPTQARSATLLLLATHLLAFVNVFTLAPLAVAGIWLVVLLAWLWLVFRLVESAPQVGNA